MFILLKISGMAWAAIAGGVLISILVVAGIVRKQFPEKKSKPWKKV